MINVSNEFKELMKESTAFRENAVITLADDTVLELTEKDFTLSNNTVTDAAEANALPLGVAISRNIQIELMNDDEHLAPYDFYGAKIRLYLTFELPETTEKIEYGIFTVTSPETYGDTVIITAQDDMYKADTAYSSNLAFPTSVKNALADACETCGISLFSTSFLNDDFIITSKPSSEYTFRQVIGYIAMIAGGNARINLSGYLEIKTYDFSDDSDRHELTDWINLKADTSDITITGIQTSYTTYTEDSEGESEETEETVIEGETGYVLTVDNPLASGKESELVKLVGDVLIGATFRVFSGDYIGYPLAEFMDLADITDRKGNTYTSVITDISFTFLGTTTLKNSAESGLRNASQYYSNTTDTLVQARKMVEREKTNRELAIEKLSQELAIGNGMYMTTVIQPDGSTIYYMHNKPTLEESNIVWKMTIDAFGISTDGGETYPYGFNINGETLTRVMMADRVEASDLHITGDSSFDGEANATVLNVKEKIGFYVNDKDQYKDIISLVVNPNYGGGAMQYLDLQVGLDEGTVIEEVENPSEETPNKEYYGVRFPCNVTCEDLVTAENFVTSDGVSLNELNSKMEKLIIIKTANSETISLAASGNAKLLAPSAPDGYTIIGVVSASSSNTNVVILKLTTSEITVRNLLSQNAANTVISGSWLYIRKELI